MDWFNTGLYRDLGYGFVYPQVLDHYRHADGAVQSAALEKAREKVKKWLKVFDEHLIGPQNSYVCASHLTITDFLGVCMITLGEVIHLEYSAYPNLTRWVTTMKGVPYWETVNDGFYTYFVGAYKDAPFEGL